MKNLASFWCILWLFLLNILNKIPLIYEISRVLTSKAKSIHCRLSDAIASSDWLLEKLQSCALHGIIKNPATSTKSQIDSLSIVRRHSVGWLASQKIAGCALHWIIKKPTTCTKSQTDSPPKVFKFALTLPKWLQWHPCASLIVTCLHRV